MKAIVKRNDAPGLTMEEVDTPTFGPNEVLIKPTHASICGTDIHIYKWDEWAKNDVPLGTTVGHEFVGVVAEIGKNVQGIKVGDRVSGEGHITCGQCRRCREGKKHLCPNTIGVGRHYNGCFAEYLTLPVENVFHVPDNIPNEIAAIFDPLGNAVHTALSFDLVGEDVLITGAGPIGAMAAAVAKHAGARNVVITDLIEYRLDLAKTLGATTTVNITKEKLSDVMKRLDITEGFTVGLEMSGNGDAFKTLLESLMPGGKVGLLGILPLGVTIDWDLVIFKMLEIKGIYGREIFSTWHKMSHMLQSGLNLEPLITHQIPAQDFEKGFEAMFSGQSGKVILEW